VWKKTADGGCCGEGALGVPEPLGGPQRLDRGSPQCEALGAAGCDPGGMKSHQVSDEGGYAAGRNKCYPLGRHAWQHHR